MYQPMKGIGYRIYEFYGPKLGFPGVCEAMESVTLWGCQTERPIYDQRYRFA